MKKLLMLRGLPACGKSTYAFELVAGGGWLAVTKDDIRKGLEQGGWVWSQENERDVEKLRDQQIELALKAGLNVVSADTNFARKHKARLEQLALKHNVVFEVKDLKVDVEECIRRDKLRENGVGEGVIRKMAKQYVLEEPALTPYGGHGHNLKFAVICDLDGTLSLFKKDEGGPGHRGPYDATRCDEDTVNLTVLRLLNMYAGIGYQIIYLSGREDIYRAATERFLVKNACPEGPLFMRKKNDTRKDFVVKHELFNDNVRGKWNIELVLDDRTQVVRMWRQMGLTVHQVANGDF